MMAVITCGTPAINRNSNGNARYAQLNLGGTANGDGIINSVSAYMTTIGSNMRVGLLYLSGGLYYVRSSADVGLAAVGLNTWPVSMVVVTGDYLAIVNIDNADAYLDLEDSGGVGRRVSYASKLVVGTSDDFSGVGVPNVKLLSLLGTGITVSAEPIRVGALLPGRLSRPGIF